MSGQRITLHRTRLTLADLRDLLDMAATLDWPDTATITDDGRPITRLTATHPQVLDAMPKPIGYAAHATAPASTQTPEEAPDA